MKKKKTALLAGLLGAGVLTASAQFYRKIQEDRKKAQALQEVRDFFADLGEIATVYVDETASTQTTLIGGVVMEAEQVFLFENTKGSIQYREGGRKIIFPTNLEEVAALIEDGTPTVFLFVTTWCGDCHYIKPHLPAIEEAFPDFRFVQLDRDDFMPLAQEWAILGIPSLVVLENGKEIGRFVDKNRKTKEEIMNFLSGLGR